MHHTILLAVLAGIGTAAAAQAAPADNPMAFSSAITAPSFRAYDQAISTDAMDGRKPGTPGAEKAKAWIVHQFQQIGLEPGNHGSWFQAVPTVTTTLENPTGVQLQVKAGKGNEAFAYGPQMVAQTLQAKPRIDIKDSPIVFVGYGVDAPAWQWNDYRHVDVKGKTVVVLVNDPGYATHDASLFKGNTMTYYGRWTYKYAEAAKQGAAMCLIVHTSNGAAGYPWSVVKNSWTGPQIALPEADDPGPRLPVAGWLTHAAAQKLFASAGLNFDELAAAAAKRGFQPVALKATASIAFDNTIAHGKSDNILGIIRGTTHPDQAVVYSAHWDHLGEDDKLHGDKIFNGAVDNGTGISALLEIAKAFKAQHPAPQRSVLFLADTLEESGLLGSAYYVKHPVVPLKDTVADINMDMLIPIGPTRNMQIIGSGESQLEDRLKAVLKQQGRYAIPDQDPSAGLYFRSDHFSFAQGGVPAIMTQTGDDMVEGGRAAGRKQLASFIQNRYHTQYDNFDPKYDFHGDAEDAEALYELGRQLAAGEAWPEWYPDSAFRAKRVEMMQH